MWDQSDSNIFSRLVMAVAGIAEALNRIAKAMELRNRHEGIGK